MTLDSGVEGVSMPPISDRVITLLVELQAALEATVYTPLHSAASINAPPVAIGKLTLVLDNILLPPLGGVGVVVSALLPLALLISVVGLRVRASLSLSSTAFGILPENELIADSITFDTIFCTATGVSYLFLFISSPNMSQFSSKHSTISVLVSEATALNPLLCMQIK